jgi:hypothetical protein
MLLGGALCSAYTAAQSSSIEWKDYDYIKNSDARLTGYNASGLKHLSVDRIASANIFANKQNGKFINYHQSDDSYTLGAQTESFLRLSPKIVFYGKISYDNFTGKNMGGSAFINPYYNPFDIVEYSDSTRGKKNLETYHLTGAASADLTERLTIGGKVDYTATNYAKQKDLRHKNKMLDLYATAGLTYRINTLIEAGASYYYRRSVEGLKFDMYGTNEKQYFSLINYGAFFGKTEMFGSDGYTDKDNEKPMFNEFHGASLSLDININPEMHFFNEITYKLRDGEYGRRSARDIVYSEHNSVIYEYNGSLSYKQGENHHLLNVNFENETLENFENIYRLETRPGGSSYIVYYDQLKAADKERLSAKALYTAYLGIKDYCPTWILKGGAAFQQNKLTASLYPFYRKQTIQYTDYNIFAARNIVNGKNMYSFSVDAHYISGGGTKNKDGEYATPGDSQTRPRYTDINLNNEYEYLTTDQVKANIGIKYSRKLEDVGINGYAALNYSLTKAFEVKHLPDDNFSSISLSLGCVF